MKNTKSKTKIIMSILLANCILLGALATAEEMPRLPNIVYDGEAMFAQPYPNAQIELETVNSTNSTKSFFTLDQSTESQTVYLANSNGIFRAFIKLTGEFLHTNRSLLVNGKVLVHEKNAKKEKSKFSRFIEIEGNPILLDWVSIDANGEMESAITSINIGKWRQMQEAGLLRSPHTNFWTATAGLSFYSYQETRNADFENLSTHARIGYSRALSSKWDVAGQLSSTLFKISQNRHDTHSVRWVSGNARIGYSPSFVSFPYRLSLMAGFSYQRMFVTNNAFGYKNLFYPQFYPVLSYLFKNRSSGYVFLKYVPLNKDLKINLREREITGGMGYHFTPNSAGNYWLLTLDATSIKVTPIQNYHLNLKSYSLSFGRRL